MHKGKMLQRHPLLLRHMIVDGRAGSTFVLDMSGGDCFRLLLSIELTVRREVVFLIAHALTALLAVACSGSSSVDRTDTSAGALTTVPPQPVVSPTRPETVATATPSAPLPVQVDDSSAPRTLTCTPDKLGPGDTVTLTMSIPHGEYLRITTPTGNVHFVIYPQFGQQSRRFSLVPSDSFRNLATIRLPADLRAKGYATSRDTVLQTVFSKTGKYELLIGENLESDRSEDLRTCAVTFAQTPK